MTRTEKTARLDTLKRYSTKERISAEQERALIARAQAGDTRARHELGRVFLGYVLVVAAKSRSVNTATLEDIIHEGSIGLMIAIDKFDLSRPVRFGTYANHWIRAVIRRHLQQYGSSIVRPRSGEFAPLDDSLDAPIENHPGGAVSGREETRMDRLVDEDQGEDNAVRSSLGRSVREALGEWDHAIDREILARRLSQGDDGDSLDDIGRRHGVTRECVRLREKRVKAKLRIRLARFAEAA